MYIRFLFNIGECICLVSFWGVQEIYTLLHINCASMWGGGVGGATGVVNLILSVSGLELRVYNAYLP